VYKKGHKYIDEILLKEPSKIKLFVVTFDLKSEKREIPAFRAAIIEKVGRENILFHNHFGQSFRYGYPLIQYKVFRRNPTIVCINDGSEEILKFFEQTKWDIVLNGKKVNFLHLIDFIARRMP
jgi:hypothetical protein